MTLYHNNTAIAVSNNLTLKAIAYKVGMTDSLVASATYTIQVATPTFNPPAGAYGSAQSVILSSTTAGASIRYTTDGSTPTSSVGTLYNNTAIAVSNNLTLKAIAYETGMTDSLVASAAYTIQVATPTFNPPAGAYRGSAQSVILGSTTAGASIRYHHRRIHAHFLGWYALQQHGDCGEQQPHAESHRLQDRHDGQPGGFSRLHHHRRRRNALVQLLLDQPQSHHHRSHQGVGGVEPDQLPGSVLGD